MTSWSKTTGVPGRTPPHGLEGLEGYRGPQPGGPRGPLKGGSEDQGDLHQGNQATTARNLQWTFFMGLHQNASPLGHSSHRPWNP